MTYTPSGSRVASLADRLQRPPHANRPGEPGETASAQPRSPHTTGPTSETPALQPSTTPDSSTARSSTPSPPPSSARSPRRVIDDVGAPRQISFLLTPELRDRLRRHMTLIGATMAEVLLDAVESAHPALDQLLANQQPQVRTGPLFTRVPKPTTADVKVQVNVRLPSAAITTLDRLVEEHEARNRTQLIAVALDHHLTRTETQHQDRA